MQPPIAFDMSCPESLHVYLIVCLFGPLKHLFDHEIFHLLDKLFLYCSLYRVLLPSLIFSFPLLGVFLYTRWCRFLWSVSHHMWVCIQIHIVILGQTHMCQVPKAFQEEGRVPAGPSCLVKWRWQMTVLSVCLFSSVYNFVNTLQTAKVITKI